MTEAEKAFHELADTCRYRASFTDCQHGEGVGQCSLVWCPLLREVASGFPLKAASGDSPELN